MTLRLVLLVFAAVPYLYDLFRLSLLDKKRLEPLPREVADVYTKERWETFVAYKKDLRTPYLLSKGLSLLMDAFVILSPFYAWIERLAGGNPYGVVLWTVGVFFSISFLIDLPFAWYRTFVIENRYGLNHRTPKEFAREQIIELLFGLFLTAALYSLLAFVMTNLSSWTSGFTVPLWQAVLIAAAIAAVFAAFVFGASFISWRIMRIQYKFTPLEDEVLKAEIEQLLVGSRKKVRKIEVYNESAKSTSKNAFVLKLPLIRTIGIADNFLNENSHRELLAVLAHEAGHLKHRPNIWNYLNRAMLVVFFALLVLALVHGAALSQAEKVLEASFGLTVCNAVLSFTAVSWIGTPLLFLLRIYRNYVSRTEEYEADRNAVKEGYGEELIQTFKTLSSDELVDVNPPQLIETLEFDHPGMYHRITAIHEAMAASAK